MRILNFTSAGLVAILAVVTACSTDFEIMDDMKRAAGDNKACAKSIDRYLDRADEIMKNMKHQF